MNRDHFHVTTRSVFEVKLLNQMTYSIIIGKMKFISFAKTYNLLHGSQIQHNRFIDAFYAYHVAKRIPGQFFKIKYFIFNNFQGCPLVHSTNNQGAVDVEFMCLQVGQNVSTRANNSKKIPIFRLFLFLKKWHQTIT